MGRAWGRLYTGTRHHRKIRVLRQRCPDSWWILYPLLEMAFETDDEGLVYLDQDLPYTPQELAEEVGMADVELLSRTLQVMADLKLLSLEDGFVRFLSYNERQYKSDASGLTDRVERCRQKQVGNGSETMLKRVGNGSVTPDTETETETETDTSTSLREVVVGQADDPLLPEVLSDNGKGKRRRKPASFTPNDLGRLWNEVAHPAMPRVILPLSQSRINKFRPALTERQDPEWWKALFVKAGGIPGLRGENDRGWRADLEFVVRRRTEILEGKYDSWGTAIGNVDGVQAWLKKKREEKAHG
ncbi:MAG: phage replisome organizer N-terminal domain-containing protein [Deltaproteobacteria bacterium]|nr:phage replisome organizer N-terminal domain-containing protein [Deltaproteobacteria bacterium]